MVTNADSGLSYDSRLWYVHDPMCSWCWAFRPNWQRLCQSLPENLGVHRLVGGLAPDCDEPMPGDLRTYLQDTWRQIEKQVPGTRFNFAFWETCQPRRSTYPACRAVLATRLLAPGKETEMIDAIQRAYYLNARNPSDTETLIELATEIGLDPNVFAHQLLSDDTQQLLEAELAQARNMGANSFPSLIVETTGGLHRIAIDYRSPTPMLSAIDAALE